MIKGLDLNTLKYPKVFEYFEEISNIPRGSGNTKEISNYIYNFGKDNGFETYQDDTNNVIIIKQANEGYEKKPAIMLQGHIDMVAEKDSTSIHDFLKDPLDLHVENGFLKANGTTLGADDGIAVAYMLAILSDESIKTPRLECVFTVDEETGMDGAVNIDLSICQSRRLINLDSETEGEFTVGCAGGARLNATLPLTYEKFSGKKVCITIGGLKGGHSGDAIHLGRGNAINIASRLINLLEKQDLPFGLINIKGGSKDNAIPRESSVTIATTISDSQLNDLINDFSSTMQKELCASDPDITFTVEVLDSNLSNHDVISPNLLSGLYSICQAVPNGVIAMSQSIDGLTETSSNLGILNIENDVLHAVYLLRSSIDSRKMELLERMEFILTLAGVTCERGSSYPGWPYNPNSPLQNELSSLWGKLFGSSPKITAIHGGLECGLICDKLPGIDIVSTGPDNIDIHTPQERMSIESAERVFSFVTTYISSL